MTAFLAALCALAMLLGVLGIIAAAAIWLANADAAVEIEARRIAADNDWSDWDALSDSDSPIHDALAIERFHQQLADDDLIRRAEQWGA